MKKTTKTTKTRKQKKQRGGDMDEAKRRIDAWKAANDPTKPLQLTGLGLISLPSLPDNLQILMCANNQLTRLPPELPNELLNLQCGNNRLTQLPELPDTLTSLSCGSNKLIQLPPELPNKLIELECSENNLTSFPELPDNLKKLLCYNNKLRRLPELSPTLKTLHCDGNQLTDLPPLPSILEVLTCADNQLTELPSLPANLRLLDCEHNNLPPEFYKFPEDKSRKAQIDYVERVRKIMNRAPEVPINFSKTLEISESAQNIYLQPIKNGEKLANIPRSANKYNSEFGSYITYNTYRDHPITKNPSSRYNFNKKNVKYYTAKVRKNANGSVRGVM